MMPEFVSFIDRVGVRCHTWSFLDLNECLEPLVYQNKLFMYTW
jgi:hypothetical protein